MVYFKFFLNQDQVTAGLDFSELKKEFVSEKINNKLVQQLQEPLVLASRSLPDWCKHMLTTYKFLFPFETRQLYFTTTAFGVSRSIVWLQNKRDALLANLRNLGGSAAQRAAAAAAVALRNTATSGGLGDTDHEYRIGRLKHERIKIPREPREDLLRSAINTLKFHATRKAILEIEFIDEEGTGLGPTLEFFSLIATELQRKKHGLWYCDDDQTISTTSHDELFVHQINGLFPAAYPPDQVSERLVELFNFIGIFLAKSLQDQRLVDIPLSKPLLRILCASHNAGASTTTDESSSATSRLDLTDLLDLNDLELIDPHRARLLKHLSNLKQNGTQEELDTYLDSLGLVFEYNPPSKIYGYQSYALKPDGQNINVNSQNVDEYVSLMSRFLLNQGIEKQLQAFKEGFDSVFSMDALRCFEPDELQLLISGEQAPTWTYDEILTYTEPKLGYTKESHGFQLFVNVMCKMDADERKTFVQFLTGCSSLPPGGLANLHPRLTVVKKEGNDSSYPSVNTCVHYLKLPEYSCEETLKRQLFVACQEKGFYLN